MTLTRIALLNLLRRKSKAIFVLAGLTIGVSTMVTLNVLTGSLTTEINKKLEKYGANILILPKSEQLSLTYEGMSLGGFSIETGELKETDLERIKTIKNAKNVAAVGPMVIGAVEINSRALLMAGVDFKAYRMLKPWWEIDGARPGAEQLLAGSEAARILGLKKNQEVKIGDRSLQVSGVLKPTGSQDDALVFTRLETAQGILGMEGKISMAEAAALCLGCPITEMVRQIGEAIPNARVTAVQSVVKGRMEMIKNFERLSLGISILVFLVGGLVVLVTVMGSVKERTGEIGVLRTVGFRKGHIMKVVLTEAFILSAIAGVLGYLIGLGGGELALPFFAQTKGVHVSPAPFLALAALAVSIILGFLASLYPALSAARLDPHKALRTI